MVAELKKHAEAPPREGYALGALRLGVLALRQAAGAARRDCDPRSWAETDLQSGGTAGASAGRKSPPTSAGALRQYFDPTTGALPQRIEALLRNDGELDRALRTHLAPENSTIARALAVHIGEGSPLFKLLSPTDATGLKAQISAMLESVLEEQQAQILKEFSLDNKESALSRLVTELATNNGELNDRPEDAGGWHRRGSSRWTSRNPALSRLVGKVEAAQQAIADEFSSDNEQSAITRLSRMLQDTRQQIDKNLTLDDDTSALSRLKREVQTTIETLVKSNGEFQSEVRATLASMQARKEEAARSTQHGHTFEDQLGLVLAAEAQRFNDPYEATGTTTGAIKHCKTGISSLNWVRTAPPLVPGSFGKRRTTRATI